MTDPAHRMCCPLCVSSDNRLIHAEGERDFLRCNVCRLIFVPASQHLSPDEEQAHYRLHCNEIEDEPYREFLRPAADAVRDRVPAGALGLDFGCGSGPALADILTGHGYRMSLWDPFFHPTPEPFGSSFDFVTATEVFEHLREPRSEIPRLWQCVAPRGCLVVMTRQPPDEAAFPHWYYRLDPTHVGFYSPATFEWVAQWIVADLEVVSTELVVMSRPSSSTA